MHSSAKSLDPDTRKSLSGPRRLPPIASLKIQTATSQRWEGNPEDFEYLKQHEDEVAQKMGAFTGSQAFSVSKEHFRESHAVKFRVPRTFFVTREVWLRYEKKASQRASDVVAPNFYEPFLASQYELARPTTRPSTPAPAEGPSNRSHRTLSRALTMAKEYTERIKQQPRSIFGLPVLSPYHVVCRYWVVIMLLVDLSYTAFVLPTTIAFCPDTDAVSITWCSVVELIFGAIFNINLLLEVHMGFILSHEFKHRILMDGDLVASFYVHDSTFYVDVIAIAAFWYQVYLLAGSATPLWARRSQDFLLLIRLVRLYPVLRSAFSTWAMYRLPPWLPNVPIIMKDIIILFYTAAFVIHALTCMMYKICVWEGLENSWFGRYQFEFGPPTIPANHPLSWDSSRQYLQSLYFTVTTLTTVGYGDIKPITVGETLYVVLLMLLSQFLFAVILIYITEAARDATTSARQANLYRKKVDEVNLWMSRRELPEEVQSQVYAYYSDVWLHSQNQSSESTILEELPHFLRFKVSGYITLGLLKKLPMFKDLEELEQQEIASKLIPLEVPPGHEIFEEGMPNDSMILVREGDVLVIRGFTAVDINKPPFVVGDSCMLSSFYECCKRRPYTLRALSTCYLWELPLEDLELMFIRRPELRRKLMTITMAHLLGHLNEEAQADSPTTDSSSAVSPRPPGARGLNTVANMSRKGTNFTDLMLIHAVPGANEQPSTQQLLSNMRGSMDSAGVGSPRGQPPSPGAASANTSARGLGLADFGRGGQAVGIDDTFKEMVSSMAAVVGSKPSLDTLSRMSNKLGRYSTMNRNGTGIIRLQDGSIWPADRDPGQPPRGPTDRPESPLPGGRETWRNREHFPHQSAIDVSSRGTMTQPETARSLDAQLPAANARPLSRSNTPSLDPAGRSYHALPAMPAVIEVSPSSSGAPSNARTPSTSITNQRIVHHVNPMDEVVSRDGSESRLLAVDHHEDASLGEGTADAVRGHPTFSGWGSPETTDRTGEATLGRIGSHRITIHDHSPTASPIRTREPSPHVTPVRPRDRSPGRSPFHNASRERPSSASPRRRANLLSPLGPARGPPAGGGGGGIVSYQQNGEQQQDSVHDGVRAQSVLSSGSEPSAPEQQAPTDPSQESQSYSAAVSAAAARRRSLSPAPQPPDLRS